MSCVDCFNNCRDSQTTDECVKYTGPDISFLGIKQGDQLSSLEAALVAKLLEILDGSGITLSTLTSCASIDVQLVGKDNSLVNIVQAIYTVICTLRTDVNVLQTNSTLPTSFNIGCLTGLPLSPNRDDILQAVITALCAINLSVTNIQSTYVTSANLCTLVQACITGGATGQENAKMPKYCPIPYYGPLSVFDGAGSGISALGYDRVYLCVGQTVRGFVLPDTRGRTLVGANIGMPGGSMDSAVDPGLPQNAGYNVAKGSKIGEYTHKTTLTEEPPHTHSVNDPGHTHTIGFGNDTASGNNFHNFAKLDATTSTKTTNSNTTGITINSSGGGQPHNNTQPSIGVYYIIYIP